MLVFKFKIFFVLTQHIQKRANIWTSRDTAVNPLLHKQPCGILTYCSLYDLPRILSFCCLSWSPRKQFLLLTLLRPSQKNSNRKDLTNQNVIRKKEIVTFQTSLNYIDDLSFLVKLLVEFIKIPLVAEELISASHIFVSMCCLLVLLPQHVSPVCTSHAFQLFYTHFYWQCNFSMLVLFPPQYVGIFIRIMPIRLTRTAWPHTNVQQL